MGGAEEARLASSLALEADVVHDAVCFGCRRTTFTALDARRDAPRIGGRHVAFMHAVYKRPCQPPQCWKYASSLHRGCLRVRLVSTIRGAISPPCLRPHDTAPIGLVATKSTSSSRMAWQTETGTCVQP